MKWYKLYMPIVNLLKVLVIWLTDAINLVYYPFDLKQTYDLQPIDLDIIEALFKADMEARFMSPAGEFLYTLPRPVDAGDTALFQGLATGMKILNGDDVTKQLAFIKTLFTSGNRLIRGYWSTTGGMNDSTSNDSASGMLFFFYCALIHNNDPLVKIEATDLLRDWLHAIKADNWALADMLGNPTSYGVLDNGVLTDPLRITVLLALLALGSTFSSEFAADYKMLYDKYKLILAYPKVKLLWWDTKYDTHRAALHLHVLHTITGDDRYKKGLQRIWRITRKENNAWVYVLCYRALSDNSEAGIVKTMLSTFDFAKRQLGNVQSLNDDQPSVNWPPKLPGLTPILRSKTPLPLNKRGSQDFFWQRNMNSLDEWVGNTTADVYHSGLDFLICRALAKVQGIDL